MSAMYIYMYVGRMIGSTKYKLITQNDAKCVNMGSYVRTYLDVMRKGSAIKCNYIPMYIGTNR